AQGRMWVIKATCHPHRLRWLFNVFPDATVVHCHRDPVSSITSIADMFCTAQGMSSDMVDRRQVGQATLDYSAWQMRQCIEQRGELEKTHRIVDVSYKDIVAQPLALVERIYATAGIELSEAARAAMAQWDAKNPQHKHGRHEYSQESLGYT